MSPPDRGLAFPMPQEVVLNPSATATIVVRRRHLCKLALHSRWGSVRSGCACSTTTLSPGRPRRRLPCQGRRCTFVLPAISSHPLISPRGLRQRHAASHGNLSLGPRPSERTPRATIIRTSWTIRWAAQRTLEVLRSIFRPVPSISRYEFSAAPMAPIRSAGWHAPPPPPLFPCY